MKCYHCGNTVAEFDSVCCKCGVPLIPTPEQVQAAVARDQYAITALYEMTRDDVYRKIYPLLTDEQIAQDLMQDTFVQAFERLDTLKEAEKFRPWVKTIAHNRALNYLRRKREVLFSELSPEQEAAIPEFADDRPDRLPEVRLDQKETVRLVREILRSLPEDQRVVLAMYYYEGSSVKQIARTLDVSEAAVKSRLIYGRKKVEVKVRELEKDGVKLYSMAPISFFVALLRLLQGFGVPTGAGALPGILSRLTALQTDGAAASGAGTAAPSCDMAASSTAAAAEGGVSAAKATAAARIVAAGGRHLGVKIAAAATAVLVLGGAATGAILGMKNRNAEKRAAASATESVPVYKMAAASDTEPAVTYRETQVPTRESIVPTGCWKRTKSVWYNADGSVDHWTEYTYDEHWNRLTKSYNADGSLDSWCEFEYDENGNNTRYAVFYANGNIKEEKKYGENGSLLETTAYYSDGVVKSISRYNKNGDTLEIISYDADGSVSSESKYEYDESGNLNQLTDYASDGSIDSMNTYEHDESGNLTKKTVFNSDGTIKEWETHEYDENGNRIKWSLFHSDGSIASWIITEYNENDKMTKNERFFLDGDISMGFENEYDSSGNTIKRTDFSTSHGKKTIESWTVYEYDADNNSTRNTKFDAEGKIIKRTEYRYHINGKTSAMLTYNAEGELIRGHEDAFDANGNIIKSTQYADGIVQRTIEYKWTYFENAPRDNTEEMNTED